MSDSGTAIAVPPVSRSARQADEPGDGVGHPEPVGRGPGIGPGLGATALRPEPLDHGSTAVGLHRDESGAICPDPSHGLHLVEGLPHPHQARATPGRVDDHVGEVAAELLPELVTHCLLTLHAEWLLEGREVEIVRRAMLGQPSSGVGDGARDQLHLCPVLPALQDKLPWSVLGHCHQHLDRCRGPVRGQGAGGVARRRGDKSAGPEGDGRRNPHRHAARLEGPRWVAGLVLHPGLGIELHERRPPLRERDGRLDPDR